MEKLPKVKHYRTFKVTIILLLIFFSYFLLVIYPIVNDGFDYWHMAIAIYIEKSGFIDPSYMTAGFYILTTITSEISSISYDIIPTLPIQSIPFIFLMVILLKNITKRGSTSHLLIMGLVTIFITQFGYKSYFGFGCHTLGFILGLLVICVATLRLRSELKNQKETSLILIITIISLNYISYKLTFFTIGFLASLQIIEWLRYYRFHSKTECKKSNFIILVIIGIVNVLTFNKMFYDTFIPRLRIASEITSSGIYKLLLHFQHNQFDPLDQYYLRDPQYTLYAKLIWFLLIFIGLILLAITLIPKFIKKEDFSIGEIIVSSLVIISLFMLIIFTHLGSSEMSLFLFSGIVGYAVLYDNLFINHKKFVTFIISLLLVLNMYMIISIHEDFYDGMRYSNYDYYINAPSKWYIKYMFNENSKIYTTTVTDVFTGGYFLKEIVKESDTYPLNPPAIFSRYHILFLLKSNVGISKVSNSSFIINYRLYQFSTRNWEMFSSWSNHRQLIESNPHLNSFYSSGDVLIYFTTK